MGFFDDVRALKPRIYSLDPAGSIQPAEGWLNSVLQGAWDMSDIINDIINTEKKGEEIIQKANAESLKIKLDTEKTVNQEIARAREKAQKILQEAAENAEKEAKKIREQGLEKAQNEVERFFTENKSKIDKTADEVVAIVLHTDYTEARDR